MLLESADRQSFNGYSRTTMKKTAAGSQDKHESILIPLLPNASAN